MVTYTAQSLGRAVNNLFVRHAHIQGKGELDFLASEGVGAQDAKDYCHYFLFNYATPTWVSFFFQMYGVEKILIFVGEIKKKLKVLL